MWKFKSLPQYENTVKGINSCLDNGLLVYYMKPWKHSHFQQQQRDLIPPKRYVLYFASAWEDYSWLMGCSTALNQVWTLPVGKQAHAAQEAEAVSDISTSALKTVGQDRKSGPQRQLAAAGQETMLPTWLLAPMLSHSNCRARALYSHFLSPTQELGNLDFKIVTGI